LAQLRVIFRRRLLARAARSVFEDKDGPNLIEDALDAAVGSALAKVNRQSYLHRHSRNRKGKSRVIFEEDLQEKPAEEEESSSGSEEKQPWLNDTEFLQKYRMSRSGFNRLVALIKDHPIFSPREGDRLL
jgi:hypothetical protein